MSVLWICEGCAKRRARHYVQFLATDTFPASNFKVCDDCLLDMDEADEVNEL